MTILSDLAELVGTMSQQPHGAAFGVGRHGRGAGFVVGPKTRHCSPTPTICTTAQPRVVQGSVRGGGRSDGDLVVLDVDTGDAPRWHGPSRPQSRRATRSSW